MTRMETQALTGLLDGAEAGGYTLPTELTDAWRTHQRVKAASVEMPNPGDLDAAAARLVAEAAGGKALDAVAQAAGLEEAIANRHRADQAQNILGRAVEQSAEAATMLAVDLTETIISKHLAPAMQAVLSEAREVAAALAGHSRDPHALLRAPAKVRNAYLTLPELVGRQRAILTARRKANNIGQRKAQHDASDLFGTFRKPMTFFPTWKPPARVPMLPFPDDPQEVLLWLVSDPQAVAAQPWLPTIAEQDAAWWELFGPGQEMRAQAHRNGVAVGARIG